MNYLICYDIEDNKRRKKISDLLEGYGSRVNYSVFEFYLSKKELNEIIKEAEKILDKKNDSFRVYRVCENCVRKSFEVCKRRDVFEF
jgi:CRISPR-associated protein Cas2